MTTLDYVKQTLKERRDLFRKLANEEKYLFKKR